MDKAYFKDASFAPELVVVPAGKFKMGLSHTVGYDCEKPQHEVQINYSFAVGRFAITFDEWDHYCSQVQNAPRPGDSGWGRGKHPVLSISWDDTQDYLKWLSTVTGHNYRLLTEAEWEYAARAGTETRFWWGEKADINQANYNSFYEPPYVFRQKTLPVDSFAPNSFGLYNMLGNIREWCEDNWHENYDGAPIDGSAWLNDSGVDAMLRVLRGGSWIDDKFKVSSSFRFKSAQNERYSNHGFRVARKIES